MPCDFNGHHSIAHGNFFSHYTRRSGPGSISATRRQLTEVTENACTCTTLVVVTVVVSVDQMDTGRTYIHHVYFRQ